MKLSEKKQQIQQEKKERELKVTKLSKTHENPVEPIDWDQGYEPAAMTKRWLKPHLWD